ncbi:MAG: hypothetical protein P4L63_02770 [Candidatus Pacebacteria bacterium]|nr:hypothetical protein [Candidatus Paceibacterota bacterium]
MDENIDFLQIKIEKAKSQLSEDTLNAINAVDWKGTILKLRDKMGYSFEQLGDLETETELLLCGLLRPEDYPKELEKRMRISRTQSNDLVKEMNEQVFAKIKEEMIKATDRKSSLAKQEQTIPSSQNVSITPLSNESEEEKKDNAQILNTAGIEILDGSAKPISPIQINKEEVLPTLEKLEITGKVQPPAPSILAQKLSVPVQTTTVKTEHSLENITKPTRPASEAGGATTPATYAKNRDPYRLPIE